MYVTVCGRFGPNEGGAVGCVDRMRAEYSAKWGMYLAGMNFQTRSSTTVNTLSLPVCYEQNQRYETKILVIFR